MTCTTDYSAAFRAWLRQLAASMELDGIDPDRRDVYRRAFRAGWRAAMRQKKEQADETRRN